MWEIFYTLCMAWWLILAGMVIAGHNIGPVSTVIACLLAANLFLRELIKELDA